MNVDIIAGVVVWLALCRRASACPAGWQCSQQVRFSARAQRARTRSICKSRWNKEFHRLQPCLHFEVGSHVITHFQPLAMQGWCLDHSSPHALSSLSVPVPHLTQLCTDCRRHPHSVVLFDEVEKASICNCMS